MKSFYMMRSNSILIAKLRDNCLSNCHNMPLYIPLSND